MGETIDDRVEDDNYGPGTPCSQCGTILDRYVPEWTEYCYIHGEKRYEPLEKDLHDLQRDLIETAENAASDDSYEIANVVESFAEDLETIREKYDLNN